MSVRSIRSRVSALEGRNDPGYPTKWHWIIVDGQSEEEAVQTYEAEHGPIAEGEGKVIWTIIDPPAYGAMQ